MCEGTNVTVNGGT